VVSYYNEVSKQFVDYTLSRKAILTVELSINHANELSFFNQMTNMSAKDASEYRKLVLRVPFCRFARRNV